ncbi:MAG: response regulator [bacterium]|nr:response regulator [bacterium]
MSLAGILFSPFFLLPQNKAIKFETISLEDGLSQATVNCIIQDRRGFMWFGTKDGLNRFDGYQFTVYKHSPKIASTIGDNHIRAILEDNEEDVLWIGTYSGGLNRMDLKTGAFIHYPFNPSIHISKSHNWVFALHQDSGGLLWLGTWGGGIDIFDKKTRAYLRNYRHEPGNPTGLSHDIIRAFHQDKNKNHVLWIGTYGGGLNRFDRETGQFTHYRFDPSDPHSLSHDRVMVIYETRGNHLWVGTDGGGVNLMDRETGTFRRFMHDPSNPGSISHNRIRSIHQDPSGTLWIGTYGGGLCRFDAGNQTFTPFRYRRMAPGSLSGDRVLSIYQDTSRIIWLGTYTGGISKLDLLRRKFRHYEDFPGLPGSLGSRTVRAFTEDPGGRLWIGTNDSGLIKFDRKTQRFSSYRHDPEDPRSISHNRIDTLWHDREEEVIWAGPFSGGLNRFDKKKETFTHYTHDPGNPNSLAGDRVRTIYQDREGVLWLGAWGKGLDKFDPKTGEFTHYKPDPDDPSSLSYHNIYYIYEDRSGVLWVCTWGGGLNRFNRETGNFTRYEHDFDRSDSIAGDNVITVYEDRSGRFWVGTRGGGLNRFDRENNRWTLYSTREGLPNNIVYGILEDEEGNLWLSTNNGLSQFNPQRGTFTNYDSSDGLQSDEFSSGACYKSSGGEMFFGGINGFNSFYPSEIKKNSFLPPIYITGFRKFNRPVTFSTSIMELEDIRLSYRDNFISFEFAALSYQAPERNRYAYKLEGFDKDWVYCGTRRTASYTNLDGGAYTFRVKGSNNDGKWNEAGASIGLVITPPFLETLWFQVVVLLLLLVLIVGLYRYRTYRIRKQNRWLENQRRELEHKVETRTREVRLEREAAVTANQVKGQFLKRMSHEIRTPMNSVIGFTDMLMNSGLNGEQRDFARSIKQSGQALLRLIEDILDYARVETGTFRLELGDFEPGFLIANVCEIMVPRVAGKPVNLVYHIDERVPAVVRSDSHRFRQVVMNLVSNAVKYTQAGEVRVSLELVKEEGRRLQLRVTVRDTGLGIPPDKLEAIFEEFRQADDSDTRQFDGVGLGLTLCHQVAKRMEGDIRVRSEFGKGSVFEFFAWVGTSSGRDEVNDSVAVVGKRVTVTSPHSARILLAEDNLINQKLTRYILTKVGHRLSVVNNGKEAVDAYASHPDAYDIILMDIQMPVMDGKEATRVIRERERKRSPGNWHIPIIAVTADVTMGSRETILAAGLDDYVPKPIKRELLLEIVEKWMASIR